MTSFSDNCICDGYCLEDMRFIVEMIKVGGFVYKIPELFHKFCSVDIEDTDGHTFLSSIIKIAVPHYINNSSYELERCYEYTEYLVLHFGASVSSTSRLKETAGSYNKNLDYKVKLKTRIVDENMLFIISYLESNRVGQKYKLNYHYDKIIELLKKTAEIDRFYYLYYVCLLPSDICQLILDNITCASITDRRAYILGLI